MTVTELLSELQRRLTDAVQTWAPGTRGAWCRKQRRHLGERGGQVVWVRGESVEWAEWGARHGYFEVQYMDGLAYLRAVGAPTV